MSAQLGKIIFLHGASSSGKSTLAKALQSRIEEPFWHISIDHLRDSGVLPTARYNTKEFDWSKDRDQFFDGYHRSLAAYALAGNNLIIEHIIDNEIWFKQLVELFDPFDVFFVALHCDVKELERREQARNDRVIGSAAQDFEIIHQGKVYDLELQSSALVEDNVSQLLAAWRLRRSRSFFENILHF